MTHRKRNALTALLAAAVLTTLAMGPTAAFGGWGPGWGGGGGHDPSQSPKVFPSGKPHPTFQIPFEPVKGIHIDCKLPVVPMPSTSPLPSSSPVPGASPAVMFTFRDIFEFRRDTIAFRNSFAVEFCTVGKLQGSADKSIAADIKELQLLDMLIGKSSLSSADQGTLTTEINMAIGDLQALKTKIDADTTAADVQTDLATLAQEGKLVRGINLQVRGILGDLALEAKVTKFQTLATTLQNQIDTAASGIDTATAQKFLDDLKAKVADAGTQLGPVQGQLLGLTDAQLMAGKADPTLGAAFKALRMASFDLWMARHDSWVVQWVLAGKPGFNDNDKDDHSPAPSAAPSATPVPTVAPSPTA